jgi:predicted DNA binding CopG/RHH family protein
MPRAKNGKKRTKRSRPVPTFRSEEEEARYWTVTDSAEQMDLEDSSEEVPAEIEVDRGGDLKGVYIRLPRRLLAGVKSMAARKQIPYQILLRQWLADRLETEAGRYLPDSLEENVVLLRRFYIKNHRGNAPRQGWIIVRATKHKRRLRYRAEPWWDLSICHETTEPRATVEEALEDSYTLIKSMWKSEFKYSPRIARTISSSR